jgi:DNA-directed RNA polymerase subunit RPC12/RpoP
MAPAWSPQSACGSHMAPSASNMVHTAPIQCTQCSHMILICHRRLPHGAIRLPYSACSSSFGHVAPIMAYVTPVWCHPPSKWWNLAPIWLQFSAHGFHMAHTPPKWPHLPPIWLPCRYADPVQARSSHCCHCRYLKSYTVTVTVNSVASPKCQSAVVITVTECSKINMTHIVPGII